METFKENEVQAAINAFLAYGEESFDPDKQPGVGFGQGGYFSGDGWAARCLRWHRDNNVAKLRRYEIMEDDLQEARDNNQSLRREVAELKKQLENYEISPRPTSFSGREG